MTMCPTILVIDDNPEVAELFCTCISLCGMRAIIARNLREACDICIREHIDALLVDFVLPDGRGPDILSRLGDRCPKVRLLISGYRILEEQYPGFDEYLTKPVDCGRICSCIYERVKPW